MASDLKVKSRQDIYAPKTISLKERKSFELQKQRLKRQQRPFLLQKKKMEQGGLTRASVRLKELAKQKDVIQARILEGFRNHTPNSSEALRGELRAFEYCERQGKRLSNIINGLGKCLKFIK